MSRTEMESAQAPLTRPAVVEAALAGGDAGGPEAIGVRRPAGDRGVTPMALDRSFDGKEAERILDDVELARDDASDWRDQLRQLARSLRRVLVAHPARAAIFSSAHLLETGENAARIVDVLVRLLRRAGFSVQEAALLQSEQLLGRKR